MIHLVDYPVMRMLFSRTAQKPSWPNMILLSMFSLMHKSFCLLTINKRTRIYIYIFFVYRASGSLKLKLWSQEVSKWSCILIQAHSENRQTSLQGLRRIQTYPFLSNRFRDPFSQALDFCLSSIWVWEKGHHLWSLCEVSVLMWTLYSFLGRWLWSFQVLSCYPI